VSANRYSFNHKLVSMLLQSALDKEASTLILFFKTDYMAIIIYGMEINPFCPLFYSAPSADRSGLPHNKFEIFCKKINSSPLMSVWFVLFSSR
jgi:hypothetical protein